MDRSFETTAIILAAGRGSRLGELTRRCPKALLTVAGKSLLEWQIETLRSCGVRDIRVVTGFVRETFERFWREGVSEIYNEAWDGTNNIVTLAAALESHAGGFVLLNSDTLFHSAILRGLLSSAHANAIVVDFVKPLAAEEMKVRLDSAGRLLQIAKSIDPREAAGEYIGLAKFDAQGAAALRDALNDLIAAGHTQEWYEAGFQRMAVHSFPIHTHAARDTWIEVDTPEDLELAKILSEQLLRGDAGGSA